MSEIDFSNEDQVDGALAPEASASAEEGAEAPIQAAEAAVPEGPAMNWYIIHTYSVFENKVAESLKARASAYGFMEKVGQVLIPTEEVVELRNGKKVTSKRRSRGWFKSICSEAGPTPWARRRRSRKAPKNMSARPLIKNPGTTM